MQKVYADTSVIGSYYDPQFQEWSQALFREFISGSKKIIISEVTREELLKAPRNINELINQVPLLNKIELRTTHEAINLAKTYIKEGVLTTKSYNDALHIALATLHGADVLASWNFRHLVNINRIRLINLVNLRLRYNPIDIRTPRDILNLHHHGNK